MHRNRWVVIIYPVVTSQGLDNSGGHAHLRANVQVYKSLGYRVFCIARFSTRFLGRIEGEPCLNIVPGNATPAQRERAPSAASISAPAGLRQLARNARQLVVECVCRAVLGLLRPRVVHQRANLRFMFESSLAGAQSLVELNDEFVPEVRCDGYLTTVARPQLSAPQFVRPWPVVSKARFRLDTFLQRLDNVVSGESEIRILLYGLGGITSVGAIVAFLDNHPWLRGRRWSLWAFGVNALRGVNDDRVQVCGWTGEDQIKADRYDLGLVFYSEDGYSDERLALGCPTKLWKYIDWSLPVISNRSIVSSRYLGNFDIAVKTLFDQSTKQQYAQRLESIRNDADVPAYASELASFLSSIRRTA